MSSETLNLTNLVFSAADTRHMRTAQMSWTEQRQGQVLTVRVAWTEVQQERTDHCESY